MCSLPVKTISLDTLKAELEKGNTVSVSVGTDSMEPAIAVGDSLSVTHVPVEQLRVGDMVLMECGDEWVAHRLTAIMRNGDQAIAITRGDNAIGSDEPAPAFQILGKVVKVTRNDQSIPFSKSPKITNTDDILLSASMAQEEGHTRVLTPLAGCTWEQMVTASDVEGLSALIYHNNHNSQEWASIPDAAARHLRKTFIETLARNMIFIAEMRNVADALRGIDVILLKGAHLATSVYASPGLRPFSDIDFLVKPGDFATVEKRIAQLGYRRATSAGGSIIEADPSVYLNSAEFRKTGASAPLHAHWQLANSTAPKYMSAAIDMDRIWASARRTGEPWLTLSLEHMIIHLAEHAMRHSFDRLILLRDIAEVVMRLGQTVDWSMVVGDAKAFGLAVPVYYSLLFTSMKTGVNIPHSALAGLFPGRIGPCGKVFMKLAFSGRRSPELCNLVYVEQLPSLREKLGFMTSLAFPPRKTLALAYGRAEGKIGISDYVSRLFRGASHLMRAIRLFLSCVLSMLL